MKLTPHLEIKSGKYVFDIYEKRKAAYIDGEIRVFASEGLRKKQDEIGRMSYGIYLDGRGYGTIDDLFVQTSNRKSSLGRDLVQITEGRFCCQGIQRILGGASSNEALSFWQHMGYTNLQHNQIEKRLTNCPIRIDK